MDRNNIRYTTTPRPSVALRKESVDRNLPAVGSLITRGGVALRKESVDRNIHKRYEFGRHNRSLSARRAWIEIIFPPVDTSSVRVALRKESVDRNCQYSRPRSKKTVALRKESVDRNYIIKVTGNTPAVALRKESVDRNTNPHSISSMILTSLSARRAWIEIGMQHNVCRGSVVALRKESVDRNSDGVVSGSGDYGRSPQGERG